MKAPQIGNHSRVGFSAKVRSVVLMPPKVWLRAEDDEQSWRGGVNFLVVIHSSGPRAKAMPR